MLSGIDNRHGNMATTVKDPGSTKRQLVQDQMRLLCCQETQHKDMALTHLHEVLGCQGGEGVTPIKDASWK